MLGNKIFHSRDYEKFVFTRKTKLTRYLFFFLLTVIFLYSIVSVFFIGGFSIDLTGLIGSFGKRGIAGATANVGSIPSLGSIKSLIYNLIFKIVIVGIISGSAFTLILQAFREIYKMQIKLGVLVLWIIIFVFSGIVILSGVYWIDYLVDLTKFKNGYVVGFFVIVVCIVKFFYSLYSFFIWVKYNENLRRTHLYSIIKYLILIIITILLMLFIATFWDNKNVLKIVWYRRFFSEYSRKLVTVVNTNAGDNITLHWDQIILLFFLATIGAMILFSVFIIFIKGKVKEPKMYRIQFAIFASYFISLIIWQTSRFVPVFLKLESFRFSFYLFFYLAIVILIVIVTLLLLLTGQQETKSSIYRSTILIFGLLLIWIFLLFGRLIFDIAGEFTRINFIVAGIGTSIILVTWIFLEIQLSGFQVALLYFALSLIDLSVFGLALLDEFKIDERLSKTLKSFLDIDIVFYLVSTVPLAFVFVFNTLKWNFTTRKLSVIQKLERRVENVEIKK